MSGSRIWTVLPRCLFFLNDTATTEIYTLSLHDALPIFVRVTDWTTEWTYRDVVTVVEGAGQNLDCIMLPKVQTAEQDRKTTRLNSSHPNTSYAVFTLKKNTSTSSCPASPPTTLRWWSCV